MKKKILTFCMALVMLLSMAACSSPDAPDISTDEDTTSSAAAQPGTDPAPETTADIKPELPTYNRNGESFKIFADEIITESPRPFYNAFEEKGNVLNDAAYKRNRDIETQFNIKMSYAEGIANGKIDVLQASVASGSKEFALATSVGNYLTKAINAGCTQPLDSLGYIDFTKPYYFSYVNEEMAILGKHYSATGYFDMISLPRTMSVLFSTKLAEDNGYTNLYQLVKDGKWTFDTMLTMASSASKDLDGDGKMTETDQFGLSGGHNKNSQLSITTGYAFTKVNDKGYREPTGYNDTLLAFNDMLHETKAQSWYLDVYPNDNGTKGKNQFDTLGVTAFTENRTLFFLYDISATTDIAPKMDDYGILPIPKFTADQEDYISSCSPGMSAVPKDAADPAFSAVVLEALNYESYKTLLPAYYEITLSSRYAKTTEASEMLDIIFENTATDFVFMWNASIGVKKPVGLNISVGVMTDYVSYFDSNRELFANALVTLFDTVAKADASAK